MDIEVSWLNGLPSEDLYLEMFYEYRMLGGWLRQLYGDLPENHKSWESQYPKFALDLRKLTFFSFSEKMISNDVNFWEKLKYDRQTSLVEEYIIFLLYIMVEKIL